MKSVSTISSWAVMLVASLALAALVVFSLHHFVPATPDTSDAQGAELAAPAATGGRPAVKAETDGTAVTATDAAKNTGLAGNTTSTVDEVKHDGKIKLLSRLPQDPAEDPSKTSASKLRDQHAQQSINTAGDDQADEQRQGTETVEINQLPKDSEAVSDSSTSAEGVDQDSGRADSSQSEDETTSALSEVESRGAPVNSVDDPGAPGDPDPLSEAEAEAEAEAVKLKDEADAVDSQPDEIPLQQAEVLLKLDDESITLSGRLPPNRYSGVFLQALRASAEGSFVRKDFELSSAVQAEVSWLYGIAEAVGRIDRKFATVEIEVRERAVSFSGTLGSERELRLLRETLSQVSEFAAENVRFNLKVVPPLQPSLKLQVSKSRLVIDGKVANSQRELFAQQLAIVGETALSEAEVLQIDAEALLFEPRVEDLGYMDNLAKLVTIVSQNLSDALFTVSPQRLIIEGKLMPSSDQQLVETAISGLVPESVQVETSLEEPPAAEDDDEPGDLPEETRLAIAGIERDFRLFKYNGRTAELSATQKLILDNLFDNLFLEPQLFVSLGIDETTFSESLANMDLSLRRAEKIREYLNNLGLEPSRMLVSAYGDTRKTSDGVTGPQVTVAISEVNEIEQ